MATLRSLDFLPGVFQTDTNRKFLGATLDQMISDPQLQKVAAFVGRTFAPSWQAGDPYVQEPSTGRQEYQLEPSLVLTDATGNVDGVTTYPDLINKLAYYNVPTDNHSRLFENEYYNFDGLVEADKFINFYQYYWLPNGPDSVQVSAVNVPLVETFNVTSSLTYDGVQIDKLGNQWNPTMTLVRGGTYTFTSDDTVPQFWIQTEPGLSGFSSTLSTISTREILGLSNNGIAPTNSMTFVVPQSYAQDTYINMPILQDVNIACSLSYSQIADVAASTIINDGGIDGLLYLNNKTIIFTTDNNSDSVWTSSQTHGIVPQNERFGIWLLTIDNGGIIRLTFQKAIPVLNKVHILEGATYANRDFYRSTNFAQTLLPVPIITANLDTLYYQSTTDANQFGVINIVDSQSDSIINVDTEILGRASYTSPNGVQFTTGLKVTFDANVSPSQYQYTTYYVSGVGDNIALIPVSALVTPEIGDTTPDYITMSRDSIDMNAWARSNRWFHIDVINSTANYNNTSPIVDQSARAIRPILEFDPNLRIFNNASVFLSTVDLVDFTIQDAFSTVNGALGYYLDGVLLEPGMKILFAGDENPAVSNTIYEINFINIHETGQPQINLTPVATAVEGSGIVITNGLKYVGASYYYNGSAWIVSQRKISVNQAILFDAFDVDGNSFGDTSVYPGTTFIGTKIFGYKLGDGTVDSVLNFPLSYQVFNNIGDILFEDFYDTDTFSYLLGTTTTKVDVNTGFIHQVTDSTGDFEIRNLWVTANEPSKQYQQYTFTYDAAKPTNTFQIDVQAASDLLVKNLLVYLNNRLLDPRIYSVDIVNRLNFSGTDITINAMLIDKDKIDVFVYATSGSTTTGYYQIPLNLENNAQNALLTQFTLGQYRTHVSNQFEYSTLARGKFPGFTTSSLSPSIIDTADTISIDASNAIITADNVSPYSQGVSLESIYSGLTSNETTTLFGDSTLYSADNGYITADEYFLQNYVTGGVGVTTQNLRDLPTIDQFPGTIIQNSAGLHYAELFLTDSNYNFVNAIRAARQDYTTFKLKFLQAAITVNGVDLMTAINGVDAIMAYINTNKDSTFPYYYSDMIPCGTANLTTISYVISNPSQLSYNIPTTFNDTIPSDVACLLYLNGTQLINGLDYSFSTTTPSVTLTSNASLSVTDVLQINYYSTTDGCWVPETPSKLGLYPIFTPRIITDNTYETPISVIIGHDGSTTPAFGDFRDALILELESRIYNNIKVSYDVNKLDFNTIIPGKFRTTDYTLEEIDTILSTEFLTWATINKIDYSDNEWFVDDKFFTWNYSSFSDKDGDHIEQGYWRGIYRYFYDTDHPDTRPWEMLGFSEMPAYWEASYGPAPYTSGNLVMWQDLANGYVAGGSTQGTYAQYVRPTLLKYIPVDDNGNLISPVQSIAGDYDPNLADENYVFGDDAPPENAWRYSSEYPYAIQIMMALLKPARYFGLFLDSGYQKNTGINQFLYTNNIRFQQVDININGTTDSDGKILRVASYTNWIADYVRAFGINPQTNLVTDVQNMSIQLAYKMASFSDQSYITPILEQSSPGASNTGIIVPIDNYSIPLIKSAPVLSIAYSAVIVELTADGYSVRGYDSLQPFFYNIPSNPSSNSYTITQSGVSATVYKDYVSTLSQVPYGTTFTTRQQLVDFLVSYQRYLQAAGFIFQQTSGSLNQIQDWILSANEFLVWSQQGWNTGAAIVLSPAGTQVQLISNSSIVDAIQNNASGSRALDTNFRIIDSTRYTVLRDNVYGPNQNNFFQFDTVDGTAIALLAIDLVQWEHVIVFDNITQFNDIIYQPSTDQRQYRIRLSGYKTGGWNGAINVPGFFINQNNVQNWIASATYRVNDLVQYKGIYYVAKQEVYPAASFNYNYWQQIDYTAVKTGLIPNFANTSTQYQNFYNVDYVNFNADSDEFAKSLIGFKQRDYMSQLDIENSSQLQFYQGFIKQKGTLDAITAFTKAQIGQMSSDVNVYEEWAFRVGSYGATNTSNVVEVQLDNSTFTGNPQIVVFSETAVGANLGNESTLPSNEISIPIVTVKPSDLYMEPSGWNSNPFIPGIEPNIADQIQTAGYVRINDIDTTVFDLTKIDSGTENSIIQNIGSGYHIWTANDFNNTWNVFRVSETNLHVTTISNALDGYIQLTFDGYHNLSDGEVIAIKNFNSLFDGFYQVYNVVDLENVIVHFSTTPASLSSITQVLGDGLLFTLNSVRFSTAADVDTFTPLNGWLDNDLVWIDNYETQGNWSVLQKESVFSYKAKLERSASATNAGYGSSVVTATNGLYVLAGAPGNSVSSSSGSVVLFLKNQAGQWVAEEDTGISNSKVSGFGTSLVAVPNGFAIGAPNSYENTGYVFIGTAATIQSKTISFLQAIVAPDYSVASSFGQSLCASIDGSSLYIGAPGKNAVYYYQLITDVPFESETITVNGVTLEYTLTFTPYNAQSLVIIDANSNTYVPGVDYVVSLTNNTITFNSAPQFNLVVVQNVSYYQYVSQITSADSSFGDLFGQSITCNDDGSKLFISAPKNSGMNNIQYSGAGYVYHRQQQSMLANGNIASYVFSLPVTEIATIMIDGIIQLPSTYTLNQSTNTIIFGSTPALGSIITIVYSGFSLVQKLGDTITQSITEFGTSIDYDYLSGNLVIGSPNETINTVYYTGSVYRYIDLESVTGNISSTAANPTISTGDIFSINGFFVVVNGTTISKLVTTINNVGIPNVVASSTGNILTISSTVSSAYDKLTITPISGNTYANLGFVPFSMVQKLGNPIPRSMSKFGYNVQLASGGQTLYVGNPYDSTYEVTTFDSGITTFDKNTTGFVDQISVSGSVEVFELLPGLNTDSIMTDFGNYVQVQQLVSLNINPNDNFGTAIAVYENAVFVGSPNAFDRDSEAGIVQQFVNNTGNNGWSVYRSKPTVINYEAIKKLFIYDSVLNSIITDIELVDPIYGMIPGEARQNIDFSTNYDPASYEFISSTSAGIALNSKAAWGDNQVGMTWWDLSTVRYVEYHQGEEEYRAANWATTMTGSSIDVYEWVSSIYLPSQYSLFVDDGTPKFADDSTYTQKVTYDSVTGNQVITYYYWVKNKTSINVTSPKTLPVSQVASIIENPLGQGIVYAAILDTDAIAFFNLVSDINATNTILHIDYYTDTNIIDTNIHNEFALVAEGAPDSNIPTNIINKLVDSLSAVDKLGNVVPDPKLLASEKYGINLRPRQSMVVNNLAAMESFVEYCNGIFAENQIALSKNLTGLKLSDPIPAAINGLGVAVYNQTVPDYVTLTYLNTANFNAGYTVLVESDSNHNGIWVIYTLNSDKEWFATTMQNYDTSNYWMYTTWYSPNYNQGSTPTYTVATTYDLQALTTLNVGDTVKVLDIGNGSFEIVQYTGSTTISGITTNNFEQLALQNGTIQLDTSLYDYVDNGFGFDNERFDVLPYDEYPVTETRNIITAVLDDIFVNDLAGNFNDLFFVLLNYILSEQKYVDWVFKTSFIKLYHYIRELTQPALYQPDNQTYLEEYISEVKPYHTTIRQYILDYTYMDTYQGTITDFDLPSYYDESLGYFRSPDGSQANDGYRLETYPQYRDWYDNYNTIQLLRIAVTNGGSDYATVPDIVITGGGGSGATATAEINGSGQVTAISITFGGAGFLTAPNVFIEGGGGHGATAIAIVGNNLIRKIQTTLKFDRIAYDSIVVNWEPNTKFFGNQIIAYQNVGYVLNGAMLSDTFDSSEVLWNNTIETFDSTETNYTTGDTFDPTFFLVMADSDYTNANDRIMVLYQPVAGMPGAELNQVQTGIDYPGVMVTGLTFEDTPAFDMGAFDEFAFDATQIGPEGFPEPLDSVYDAEFSMPYVQYESNSVTYDENGITWDDSNIDVDFTGTIDTSLGLEPADMIVDGGPYQGGFNAYAPEELYNTAVFDTLDIKVLTQDPNNNTFANQSLNIDTVKFSADGHTTSFAYNVGNAMGDVVLVFTKNSGYQELNEDYTINFITKVVTFNVAPAANDVVILYIMDDVGANMIYSGEFVASNSMKTYLIEAPYESIQDSLILYNGQVTDAFTLSLAPDQRNTIFTVNLTYVPTMSVHIHLYSTILTKTDIHVQTVTMPSTVTNANYTIDLERFVYNAGPLGAQIIVSQNNNRLIPTNTAFYTGDGITTVFSAPKTQNVTATSVQITDFDVCVNGAPYIVNTQYNVLAPGVGVTPRNIQFHTAPAAGSLVEVGLNTTAQYTLTNDSTLQLKTSLVQLNPGDVINITTFSNQDTLGIRTMVFEGGQYKVTHELLGFSAEPYDSIGFDSTVSVNLVQPQFTLSRAVTNMDYLYVTYYDSSGTNVYPNGGRKLYPNYDFYMLTPTTLYLPTIDFKQTDILVVSSFSEIVYQQPIGFRMFKDMNDNWQYLRMSNAASTILAQPLHPTDTLIYVQNASALLVPNPETVTPGVVFIGGERITYWTIDTETNTLGQLRRGTLGTAVTQTTIPVGTTVEDASVAQEIPSAAGVTWYNLGNGTPSNGESLVFATTSEAEFLKEEPTFYFS